MPSAKKPAQRSSSTETASILGPAGEREGERGAARARAGDRVAQATAHQLVDEGLNRRIGPVDRLHGAVTYRRRWRWAVFIPGFMQPASAWAPGRRACSSAPTSLLDHARALLRGPPAGDRRGGAKALLVGYSLGGRLALRAALREPERYAGVVTVGATAGIQEPASAPPAPRPTTGWPRGSRPRRSRPSSPSGSASRCSPTSRRRSSRISVPAAWRRTRRELRACLRTAGQGVLEPVWHELLTFELPMLAIAGSRDDGYVRAAQKIADTAPNAKVRDRARTPATLRSCSRRHRWPSWWQRFARTSPRSTAYDQP